MYHDNDRFVLGDRSIGLVTGYFLSTDDGCGGGSVGRVLIRRFVMVVAESLGMSAWS